MKIKTFILLLFLTSSLAFPQEHKQIPFKGNEFNLLYSEINVFPSSGNEMLCFYSFRIPYNHLVFVKTDAGYLAKFSLGVEVNDSLGNFTDRQIKQDDILVQTYGETDSDRKFYQGFLTFKLGRENYNLLPVFTDFNSKEERRLHKIDVLLKTDKFKSILPPLFVNSTKEKCGSNEFTILSNYNGFLPFNTSSYDIIIPSIDTASTDLRVVIVADEDTIYNNSIKESNIYNINFNKCNNQIALMSDSGITLPTRNFIIKGISTIIPEGNLSIICYTNNEKKPAVVHYKQCVWFDKPHSLQNPEFAIKILNSFYGQEEVDKLLGAKEKDYSKVLFKFWKKYDPTPSTQFNEVMSEYYNRVDYAEKNFSSLSGKKGYETDRGKVYIQFGKPKNIERSSNDEGKVVETWIYDKDKKFVFVDKMGTGDFPLENK